MKALNNYDTISFDLFDTIFLRPFFQPKDLYIELETKHKIPGFARNRVYAEQNCWGKFREYNLHHIYSLIQPEYQKMEQIEADLES